MGDPFCCFPFHIIGVRIVDLRMLFPNIAILRWVNRGWSHRRGWGPCVLPGSGVCCRDRRGLRNGSRSADQGGRVGIHPFSVVGVGEYATEEVPEGFPAPGRSVALPGFTFIPWPVVLPDPPFTVVTSVLPGSSPPDRIQLSLRFSLSGFTRRSPVIGTCLMNPGWTSSRSVPPVSIP